MGELYYDFLDQEFIHLTHVREGRQIWLRADSVTAIEELSEDQGMKPGSKVFVQGCNEGFWVRQSAEDIFYLLGVCQRVKEDNQEKQGTKGIY